MGAPMSSRRQRRGLFPHHPVGGGARQGGRHHQRVAQLHDGAAHLIEGALQASGRAGAGQVTDVQVAFVGARAPMVQGTTFIFVKDPY